jgi:hypothetical protein
MIWTKLTSTKLRKRAEKDMVINNNAKLVKGSRIAANQRRFSE